MIRWPWRRDRIDRLVIDTPMSPAAVTTAVNALLAAAREADKMDDSERITRVAMVLLRGMRYSG